MDTQIDSFTVADLVQRYGVAKSNIYNRIKGLSDKGHDMTPEKQGKVAIYNADQVVLMDELDNHLKAGGTLANFGEDISPISPTGQLQKSYRTQDTRPTDSVPAALGIASLVDSIASKLLVLQSDRPGAPQLPPDPLANLKALQEACDRGWLLSSSQLAPLVGLKNVHGKEFERFGFRFVKAGKNGSESAWRVEKL